ncbi:MAG: M48 family metalloprotease [Thermodesulfobacteria bacterium]|nr:M48 family metalloprotease [Thermodesulfobacteriota bacterium]
MTYFHRRIHLLLLSFALLLVSCATVTGPPVTEEERYQALVDILVVKWEEYLRDQQRVGDVLYRLLLVIKDKDGKKYPYLGIKVLKLEDLDAAEKEALERYTGRTFPVRGYLVTYVTPYYRQAGVKKFDVLDPEMGRLKIELGKPFKLKFIDGKELEILPQELRTRPVDFVIVDSEEINAWVTPAYVMYVTTALCRILPSDAQLAAVIGHELAHLKRGHIMKRQLLFTLRDIFGLVVGSLGGQAEDIYRLGTNFALLKFSRDQEREADFFGLYYAYLAGYDLDEVARTWVYLGAVLPRIKAPPFLLTHPITEERLARIRKIVRLIKEGKTFEDFMKEKSP